jgi:antitoxin (DNA-binding transcriptional repressor) of toxin-antitoxin stability system
MLSVTVDEILRDPSKYLRQVQAGETFVILQADRAIAELRPISSTKQLRPFGLCASEFTVPYDFDDPLPEDILASMILEELQDDMKCDRAFASSPDALAKLAATAMADYQAGKTQELDPETLTC